MAQLERDVWSVLILFSFQKTKTTGSGLSHNYPNKNFVQYMIVSNTVYITPGHIFRTVHWKNEDNFIRFWHTVHMLLNIHGKKLRFPSGPPFYEPSISLCTVYKLQKRQRVQYVNRSSAEKPKFWIVNFLKQLFIFWYCWDDYAVGQVNLNFSAIAEITAFFYRLCAVGSRCYACSLQQIFGCLQVQKFSLKYAFNWSLTVS